MKLALAAANNAVGEQTRDLEQQLSIQKECNILTSEENVDFKKKIENLTEKIEQLQSDLDSEGEASGKLKENFEAAQERCETLETEQEDLMTKYLEYEDK